MNENWAAIREYIRYAELVYDPLYHENGCEVAIEQLLLNKFAAAVKTAKAAQTPPAKKAALIALRAAGKKARYHLVTCILQRIAARTVLKHNPGKLNRHGRPAWNSRVSHEQYFIKAIQSYRRVNREMKLLFGEGDPDNDPMWKQLEDELSRATYQGPRFRSVNSKNPNPANAIAFNEWYARKGSNLNALSSRIYNTVDWAPLLRPNFGRGPPQKRESDAKLKRSVPYQRRRQYPELFPGHP